MSDAPKAPETTRVKAIYQHLDCLLTAIDRLQNKGINNFQVLSPLPRHEIEEMIYKGRPSNVRWYTLAGAMTGVTVGFLLTSLTHAQWPMINPAGKPVVSLIPFAIIMFECTILLGALATFAGMIVQCGLPGFQLDKALQDPRVSDDKFGIVFTHAPVSESQNLANLLTQTGAVEVTSGDDTVYEVPNA
jgi:hypothetical protein